MKYVLAILLCLTLLHSTTMHGEIFDGNDVKPLNNTLITVENQEGSTIYQKVFHRQYSMEISPGKYTMRAYYYSNNTLEFYTQHSFEASGETMEFDLILIPYELQKLTPGFTPPPLENKTLIDGAYDEELGVGDYGYLVYVFVGVVLIVIVYSLYRYFESKQVKPKKRKEKVKKEPIKRHELDEDSRKVLKILKENEGRMIQKEIREILNFSETKMSLIVAELEAMGIIKRIKKGRKNILKLRKR